MLDRFLVLKRKPARWDTGWIREIDALGVSPQGLNKFFADKQKMPWRRRQGERLC
jgi:hypothetical protein